MASTGKLDRRFVDLAYGPGSRGPTVIFEVALLAAVCWIHGRAGFTACAAGIFCGLIAGTLDRAAAIAHWDRLSAVTMREVIELGRRRCLPPESSLRKLTPVIAFAASLIILAAQSERGWWVKTLTVPFLYVAWLFGRDLVLTLAPPRKN
jgi:hypothetical protein